ncbi:MAG: T9SS type A sorting domain-containing protein [Bacteroidia bacterium]
MIKKLLSSFLLIGFVGIADISAQCVPNVSCIPAGTTYGICPDSATGMAVGTVGVPYSQVMSMMVPPNGADFGYPTATIVSIDITSVDSLAPGLTYVCSPSGCSFPGNSNGCIYISGTPTTVWNHKVLVNATAHATIFGVPASLPQTNKQYRSIVVSATGIETLDLSKFDVDQNSPNPFSENTEIRFSSVSVSNIDFKVYNILGDVVYNNQFKSEKGINTIKIGANSFAPGVYIYSITNGDRTITKRMIVANK